jgi:molybdopterin converting factor small subunit
MVTIEFSGWLKNRLQADGCNSAILRKEAEHLSVTELIRTVANQYENIGKEIIDSSTGQMKGVVLMVLNGRLLGLDEAEKTLLKEGDHLLLVPVLDGG